uniref:hypothetical protein n=1 Tax=Actinoplanes rectilineatus TaxID=113571 RepID=UPI0005F2A057
GEITTIDFTSRDFTADGKDYRSLEVKLDLTSRNDRMTPDQLRDFANNIQNTIDQRVNGQYTLPGGRELHVELTVDTNGVPVEITGNPDDTTHQARWNTNDNPAVLVHEVMHY